ncbi:hypothetical protein E4U56_005351 [Claviceps arundinis]|uniref:Uncharacterized protein n=1 Tax=Claviceps arundinis TaxID=1623583 RepID=A0A9P7SMK3_9HYPO|nr:hypothetical protein E4U56_005351 [Claviceps arundinis]
MYLLSTYNRRYRDGGRPPGATVAERIIETPGIPGGTAYVIHVGGLAAEDAKSPWLAVQYQNHLSTEVVNDKAKSAILGNSEVTIRKSICSGILACEHLDPRLKDPSVYANIDAYWGELRRVRMATTQNLETQLRREAISWAWTIRKDYDERKACAKAPDGQEDDCAPTLHSNQAPEGSRDDHWVACNNASDGGRSRRSDKHQKEWDPDKFDAFLREIEQILTSTEQLPCDDHCHVVDQKNRKAKTCGK